MVLSLQLLILALAFPVVLEGTAVELRETTPALVQWALRDQLVKKVIDFTSVEGTKYQIRAVIDGLCPLKQSATFFKTGKQFSSSYLKIIPMPLSNNFLCFYRTNALAKLQVPRVRVKPQHVRLAREKYKVNNILQIGKRIPKDGEH